MRCFRNNIKNILCVCLWCRENSKHSPYDINVFYLPSVGKCFRMVFIYKHCDIIQRIWFLLAITQDLHIPIPDFWEWLVSVHCTVLLTCFLFIPNKTYFFLHKKKGGEKKCLCQDRAGGGSVDSGCETNVRNL